MLMPTKSLLCYYLALRLISCLWLLDIRFTSDKVRHKSVSMHLTSNGDAEREGKRDKGEAGGKGNGRVCVSVYWQSKKDNFLTRSKTKGKRKER